MQKNMNARCAIALVLGLAACSDADNPDGRFSLAVKDAPVDSAEAVVVEFTRVELLDAAGDAALSFDLDPPQAIDLLSLQGTNSELLVADQVVPVGEYPEIRLQVATENANCRNLVAPFSSYITVDGVDYPLVVPSGGSSGFKVKGPITVATGGLASYVVDFDLRKSIAARGNSGCYNLKPVLRVVDTAEVGTLSGIVDASLLADSECTADPVTGAGAAVYLFAGADAVPDDVDGDETDPLTSALLTPLDDGSGDFRYEVGFLLAGDYTAAFTCTASADDPETDDATGNPADTVTFAQVQNVRVDADATTTGAFGI